MNTRNDWENLLRIYNEDLEKTGYSIKITDYYNDGCYTCEFMKDGVSVMVYAERGRTERPYYGRFSPHQHLYP